MSDANQDVIFFNAQAEYKRQWRKLLKGLGKHGGRFVEIRRGSKLPTRTGWNQTANTLSVAQALEHLAKGDNIGLAGGAGNLYVIDFDRNADRGHECAQLAGGLYTYRPNAPDRAKFIVRCPDPLPTRHVQHDIDLVGLNANGTHAQATIAGTHDSGAPILWGGHTIPTLPAETLSALWEEWTGRPLFAPEREVWQTDPTYVDTDLARVANALQHVDPHDMDYNGWIGILAALHDAFGLEALDLAVSWADGKPGEVEGKWKSFDREYNGRPATLDSIFYRARKAGWVDTWLVDELRAYRRWLVSPEAIETLKEAGFRNVEQARKLLDTILQQCEERKSLRITPGYAYLSKHSTIALGGLGRYLARFYAAGLLNLQLGEKGGEATVIELMTNSVLRNVNSYTPDGTTIHIVQNWNVYREQRDSEAFMNNHAAYRNTRTQATLPSLGANGLGALLALLDGPTTVAEAAGMIGYSPDAMRRALKRFVATDLVIEESGERNRKTYTLRAEWADLLKAALPKMPTYGVQLQRHVGALKRKACYLADDDPQRAALLREEYARMAALLADVKARAGIVPFTRPQEKEAPLNERRIKLSTERIMAHRQWQQATTGEQWRRREYAKDAAHVESEWGELNAWATMEFGPGWWMRRDQTQIIGTYRIFKIVSDHVPPIRWENERQPSIA